EVQRQVGHQVVVRQVATGYRQSLGRHLHEVGVDRLLIGVGVASQRVVRRQRVVAESVVAPERVVMRRHLRLQQGYGLAAAQLAFIVQAQAGSLAPEHRRSVLQVRQSEGRFAIAAVGGAEEGKQCRVLRDRQYLAIAEGPAPGREIEGKDAYLRDERIR